jgi:hypothetical protein
MRINSLVLLGAHFFGLLCGKKGAPTSTKDLLIGPPPTATKETSLYVQPFIKDLTC